MMESLKQIAKALTILWGSKFTFLPARETIISSFCDVCSETSILLQWPINLMKVQKCCGEDESRMDWECLFFFFFNAWKPIYISINIIHSAQQSDFLACPDFFFLCPWWDKRRSRTLALLAWIKIWRRVRGADLRDNKPMRIFIFPLQKG